MRVKNLSAFFDMNYQGFASCDGNKDAWAMCHSSKRALMFSSANPMPTTCAYTVSMWEPPLQSAQTLMKPKE